MPKCKTEFYLKGYMFEKKYLWIRPKSKSGTKKRFGFACRNHEKI
jgi:hypothetical protein